MSNSFFNGEAKSFSPLVTLSRKPAFVLEWGRVIIVGRERKSFVGAFKAQNSGRESGDWTRRPFVTLSSEKRHVQVPRLLLLSRVLYGLPIVPD